MQALPNDNKARSVSIGRGILILIYRKIKHRYINISVLKLTIHRYFIVIDTVVADVLQDI